MHLKKGSSLTPFLAHQLIKFKEVGIIDCYTKRGKSFTTNCKSLYNSCRSLGFETVGVLFVFLLFGYLTAICIFFMEKLTYKKATNGHENEMKIELIALELKNAMAKMDWKKSSRKKKIIHQLLKDSLSKLR